MSYPGEMLGVHSDLTIPAVAFSFVFVKPTRRQGGMMLEELEPGPDPHRIRNPMSRKPPEPPRLDQVLKSYGLWKLYPDEPRKSAFSVVVDTETAAEQVKAQLIAAKRWLNRWGYKDEQYDIRVRPWITQHWTDADGEHQVGLDGPLPAGAKSFWKTNYWVHEPLKRGFRVMPTDRMEQAHRKSAETRGTGYTPPQRRPARTVERRAD